jgi:inosine-uridine nucleoside N-ribohydrolase
MVDQKQQLAPQAESLRRWKHQPAYPPSTAVEFLRQVVRKHPGQVTLLGIGPLTNIGLLFSIDPEIPSLLKALVLMCGSFTAEGQQARPVEWNARVDPHAAAIVYRARPPVHRSIGLDVTMRGEMTADEVRPLLQKPLLRPVLDMAETWFRTSRSIVFHDPLAAVTIFEPGICSYQRGDAAIILEQPAAAGMTVFRPSAQGAHEIAAAVQPPAFFKAFFEVFR